MKETGHNGHSTASNVYLSNGQTAHEARKRNANTGTELMARGHSGLLPRAIGHDRPEAKHRPFRLLHSPRVQVRLPRCFSCQATS
eukprot:1077709-Amphidinium_carterae.1